MLVIATSVVQLANGFFGTFVSLRVAIESFDVPGLVLSAISPASPWVRLVAAESSNGSVTFALTPHLPAWSPPPLP
jgi:hypothetical protein